MGNQGGGGTEYLERRHGWNSELGHLTPVIVLQAPLVYSSSTYFISDPVAE